MRRNVYILSAVVTIALLLFVFYRTPDKLSGEATFNGVSLRIEYALTPTAREKGLSEREDVPSDYGMLFVFPKADYYGFWMRDTLVPLDIFWLDDSAGGGSASGGKELIVVSMSLNVTPESYPNVFYPTAPALYVLETSAGFGRAYKVATGTSLILKKFPTVSQ